MLNEKKTEDVLPDVLDYNLKVIFCGTAAGKKSAARKCYYANPNNQFWSVLYRTGLTPRKLQPEEYTKLLGYGIGLTDLSKRQSGTEAEVSETGLDVEGFRSKIREYRPKAIAFNGKKAAETFYGRPVGYGRQSESIEGAKVFVMTSTSGAARGFWDEEYWRELAKSISDSEGYVEK